MELTLVSSVGYISSFIGVEDLVRPDDRDVSTKGASEGYEVVSEVGL